MWEWAGGGVWLCRWSEGEGRRRARAGGVRVETQHTSTLAHLGEGLHPALHVDVHERFRGDVI